MGAKRKWELMVVGFDDMLLFISTLFSFGLFWTLLVFILSQYV